MAANKNKYIYTVVLKQYGRLSTGKDRFSEHHLSGNDHFSSGQIIQKTTVLEEND